jgi:drug/metabolite transporter (DMT)-like permease
MKKNRLTLKVFSLIVLNDGLDAVSQVLMKKGLLEAPGNVFDLQAVWHFIAHNASSWMMWAGVVIYTLNFLIWIIVLSRLDLSTAAPLASTNYIVLPLLAVIFLHEKISLLRWAGIACVMAGIHFVSKSSGYAPENLRPREAS